MTSDRHRDQTVVGITPVHLEALEACAEALRWMLDGRANDPFTQNRAAELLARLDALRTGDNR
jgi:hypothetical protein